MPFDERTWKEKLSESLHGWKERMTRAGVKSVYAFLSAATLWPVAAAAQRGDWAALVALGSVLGGVGSNLVANQIQGWKDEADGAKRLEEVVAQNADLRQALDTLLEKLAVIEEARKGMSEDDLSWFQEVLRQEVASFGSRIHVERAAAAIDSPGAKVASQQSVVGDNFQNAVIVTGNGNLVQTLTPDDARPSIEALQAAYVNRIFQATRLVPLEAVDPNAAGDSEAKLYLNSVYTALLTLTPESHDRLMREEMTLRDVRRRSAVEELNDHNRLVLLGDPGSGKTTFVNFVVLCMAGELLGREDANLSLLTAPLPDEDGNDQENRQPWDHGVLLPIRIILRDLAARGLPKPESDATVEHLWNFLTRELEKDGLESFVPYLRKHLLEKGGIFLFDGLDEVPEAESRRKQILQVIHGIAADFPKSRVVVTSRVYAYRRQDWVLNDFDVSVLAPFSRGQIIRFADRWYEHTARVRRQSLDDARGRAALFKQRVLNNERLYKLAERPLLLTLMASLHAWRGGSLPEKREKLYEDMVELLLDWWEKRRVVLDDSGGVLLQQPSLAEFLRVGKDKILNVLGELAYEAHSSQPDTKGTADIPRSSLVEKLMSISENPDVRPARLVEYLRDRAGLLVERGVGVYAFPHRSFQEYLAAWHLTKKRYPDQVADLAREDPDRWREVALLAGAKAGHGAPYAMWALVDKLSREEPPERKDNVASEALWGAHLAGQLLAENIEIVDFGAEAERLKRIRRWMVFLMRHDALAAIERAAAGDALAKLGDPRPGVGLDENGLPDIAWSGLIEPGPFIMGNTKKTDPMAWGDESPRFKCHLIKSPYKISKYPITVAQYRAFVEDGGYEKREYWTEAGWGWKEESGVKGPRSYGEPFDLDNHPQVGVSWYEAVAFTRWLSEKLGEEVRLPTEAEWERAARHTDGRRYPWSPDTDAKPDPNRANYDATGIHSTNAVGIFPDGAAECGAEEMSGNVWEWCSTRWLYNYEEYEKRVDDDLEGDAHRVLRGGSWDFDARNVRCSDRYGGYPNGGNDDVSFRVVVSHRKTSGI